MTEKFTVPELFQVRLPRSEAVWLNAGEIVVIVPPGVVSVPVPLMRPLLKLNALDAVRLPLPVMVPPSTFRLGTVKLLLPMSSVEP